MRQYRNFDQSLPSYLSDKLGIPYHVRGTIGRSKYGFGKRDNEDFVDTRTPEQIQAIQLQIKADLERIAAQREKDDQLRELAKAAEAERERKRNLFFNRVVAKLKDAGISVLFAPLVPFLGTMRSGVELKGEKPTLGIQNLVQQFYRLFVQKYQVNSFDGQGENSNGFAPILGSIISAVVAFIADVMKNKKEGKPLSDVENFIAVSAERVEENIDAIKEDQIDQTIGNQIRLAATGVKESGLFGVILLAVGIGLAYKFLSK